MITSLWQRVLNHVEVKPDAGCWIWTGYINPQNGYGQVSLSGEDLTLTGLSRVSTAPRLVCTLVHGHAPGGMVVLHLCDERTCCAPHHLRWGTVRENNQMAWDGGAQPRGEAHGKAKYTDGQIEELRRRVAEGETAYAVAKDLGINESYAYKIAKGQFR